MSFFLLPFFGRLITLLTSIFFVLPGASSEMMPRNYFYASSLANIEENKYSNAWKSQQHIFTTSQLNWSMKLTDVILTCHPSDPVIDDNILQQVSLVVNLS